MRHVCVDSWWLLCFSCFRPQRLDFGAKGQKFREHESKSVGCPKRNVKRVCEVSLRDERSPCMLPRVFQSNFEFYSRYVRENSALILPEHVVLLIGLRKVNV